MLRNCRAVVFIFVLVAPWLALAASGGGLSAASVRQTPAARQMPADQQTPAARQTGRQAASPPQSLPQVAAASALMMDLSSGKVLYASHADQVRPMASLTKLMTAMVVLDAQLPLDELLTVDVRHVSVLKGVSSRLRLHSKISRKEMLLLALMSSENRAAASLANHYPGGYPAFIRAMNAKAQALGMQHTHYVEPTGLSPENVSTASDLAKLVIATTRYPLIGKLSTTESDSARFTHPAYSLSFRNTNHLLFRDGWQIQLSKTGFTNAAGHCLVMRVTINQRPTVIVLLDAFGKYTHFADASRLRRWMETGKVLPVPQEALTYKRQQLKTENRLAANCAASDAGESAGCSTENVQ